MEQELNSVRAQLAETRVENSKIMLLESQAAQNGLLGDMDGFLLALHASILIFLLLCRIGDLEG